MMSFLSLDSICCWFIADLQATEMNYLWPEGKVLENSIGVVWLAATKVKIGPAGVKRKGGKSGTTNFSKKETKALLDIVEEILPCWQIGWEKIATKLYKCGFKNRRNQDLCKYKFDKLWCTKMSTRTPMSPSTWHAPRISKSRYARMRSSNIPASTILTQKSTTMIPTLTKENISNRPSKIRISLMRTANTSASQRKRKEKHCPTPFPFLLLPKKTWAIIL